MVATAIRHTGRDGSVVLLGHNIKAHAGWLEGLETGDGVLVCDIALAFQALYRVPAETSLAHKMKVCNIEVDQACHECMDSIGGLRVFVRMLNVATVMGGKG